MFCGVCVCIVLVFIHIDITSVPVSPQCRGLSMSSSWLNGPSGSGGTISSPHSVTSCGEMPSTLRRPMPSVLSWRRKYVEKKNVWIVSTIRERFQGGWVKTFVDYVSWIDIVNEVKIVKKYLLNLDWPSYPANPQLTLDKTPRTSPSTSGRPVKFMLGSNSWCSVIDTRDVSSVTKTFLVPIFNLSLLFCL